MTALTGTARLTRLVLRRDRLRLALWIAGLGGVAIAQAASLLGVYPDEAAVRGYVELFGDNPALIAFAGPGYGFDDPNIGVVLVNELQVFGCIGTALMSIFLVVRHTRAEEDAERTDLVRSAVVGRHAPAAATLAVVAGANVLVGLICLGGFVALGYPVTGSVALVGSLSAVGLVFAGAAAVAAQVASGARAALGWASAALGAAFVVRAAGDIGGNGLSWLSPIGWGQAVRAYAGERWWTLIMCAAVAAALTAAAFRLSAMRDLGSGLRPQRAGPASARRGLGTPLGLAWRSQRAALAGWLAALFLTGIAFGSLGEDVDRMLDDNPALAEIYARLGGASLTDSFLATSLMMLALIAGGFAVSSALHLRGEEAAGRLEAILAAPVGRWRWALGGIAVAVAGTVATVVAGGLGVGAAYAVVSGDPVQVPRLVAAALVTVPGVLVLVGVVVALMGLAPRAVQAAWLVLTAMAVVGFLADVLQLPDWVRAVSPLEHLPAAPAEPVRALPVVAVCLVAGGLVALGLWALRRRDVRLG